ncbi:MAG: DinB family protein [Planctomyces sp.]|nr:DinB family protein [Planctomyces sp.]
MSPAHPIVYSLNLSRGMLHMFVDDLTPEEWLHRPCPGANCAAWIVGHLVVVEGMFHKRFGAESPPLPEGFEAVFARDEVAPARAEYGDVTALMPLFDAARDVTIAAVSAMTPERLAEPLTHQRFSNIGEAAAFCSLHGTMHAGQISLIRRSLGRPPVV